MAEIRNFGTAQESIILQPHPDFRITDAGGAGEAVSYLHRDHLSSVRLITNAAGQVEQATSYTPYGDPTTANTASIPEEHSFIGERFDTSTGLLYLNARYYDPALGRFMQPDTWEVRRVGVGTNRYTYSDNDPINNSDRNGHGWVSKLWKLITTGGDVAATTSGMVEDATTIISPASTGWQRAGATVSLASEYLPISVRDAKAIGRGTARGWRWLWNNPNRSDLISSVIRKGEKITPENVVDIARLPNGREVWLETGSSSAGLQHILERHADDFANRGVDSSQVPDLIFEAIKNGRVIGSAGSGKNIRSVYQVEFNGSLQVLAVGVSENGFIVTALPN